MNKKDLALIKKALSDIDNYDIKRLNAFPTLQIPNAEEFDRKMLAIGYDCSSKKPFSIKKRIIILIAAAFLLSLSATAYAFRENIKDFFLKKYNGNGATFSYEYENPTKVTEGIFHPTWLPEGFTEVSYSESDIKIQTIWLNKTDRIVLMQNKLSGSISFDTENSNYERLIINDQTYYYIFKNNTQSLFWMNDKYSFTLWCTDLTKEDVFKIATSLKLKE